MKLLVTGSNGLVGSALTKFADVSIDNSIDLTKEECVLDLYSKYKPDYVIHTAAKVGGVGGNALYPAEYFYKNILMNTYMIHYACMFNVKKFFAFSSVCAFPDGIKELKEELLHQGEPSKFNTEYANAKRMVDIQIRAYQKQHNVKNYCSIIPVNIFGENDRYNIDSGHVIPSLIHKIYKAKQDNTELVVWGDGSPEREFIYSKDVAEILIKLLSIDVPTSLILSNSENISIRNVVNKLSKVANYNNILFDKTKPNGQLKRPSNTSLLKSLINFKFTDFDEALENSYNWFVENYPNVRI